MHVAAEGEQRAGIGADVIGIVNEPKRRIEQFPFPPMQSVAPGLACARVVIARHDMNHRGLQASGPRLEIERVSRSGCERGVQKVTQNDQPTRAGGQHQSIEPLAIGLIGPGRNRDSMASKMAGLAEVSVGDDDGAQARSYGRAVGMQPQDLALNLHGGGAVRHCA